MTRDTLITPVLTVENDASSTRQDMLAVEEPLEIRLGGTAISVTMRTPGHDLDLATGFLLTEGIVEDVHDIASLRTGSPDNLVFAELKPGFAPDTARVQRNFYATSSCGICGKASIAAIETLPRRSMPSPGTPRVDAATIHTLPDLLRHAQPVFERTGGLHAAGLFSPAGQLLALREDVGRHNALDKLIGYALREDAALLSASLVLVSGRAGFELVQKCVMAGIPILAAVGAPSSLAVETARRFGITLLGFVRDHKFNIYSGRERIQ